MSGLRQSIGKAAGVASRWRPPTLLLGLLLSLATWNVVFFNPSPGLDVSWWAGIYMASHQGLQWGTEVVFTYGPLGFLKQPFLWYDGLGSLSYIYVSAAFIVFSTLLVWTLRRKLSTPVACVVAFLALALLPSVEFSIGIAALGAFAVLSGDRPRHALTVLTTAGAVLSAAECLMKISTGPVVAIVLLIALIGARPTSRQIGTFVGAFVASLFAFWLVAGQNLGNLPDFAINSIQIVAGYSEAMSAIFDSPGKAVWIALAVIATIAWSWSGDYPDRRARYSAAAVALVIGAATYKQGVVRMDDAHLAICFSMLTIIWLAVPVRRSLLPVLLAGAAIFGSISFHNFVIGASGTDVITNIDRAADGAKTVVSSGSKQNIIDERRLLSAQYFGFEPRVFEALEGKGVSVDPYEISAVWSYDLDWSPLPVFQGYSAYTPRLDRLNADAIKSTEGPDRILRQNVSGLDPTYPTGALDGRFPGWDPPAQAIATICNFEPTLTSLKWQVLSRVSDRCGDPVPAGVIDSSFNEVVEVPKAGKDEVVYAKVQGAEVKGLEKIRSLLYRPAPRYAVTSDGNHYRLIGATAGDGLLLRSGRLVGDGPGPYSQVPQTDTIELIGKSGDLTYEFFRMKVRPAND